MDPHKLGCFTAVHAGIQHKCLQCFQKLFALIFTGFLKRFQKFDIVFLDESALDLDVDAVAYQSQFIFGKNPFVREYTLHEGPAFADKTICISRTFDPIETSDMEDPRTLIALEPVEKLHTAVFQIGPGNFVFVSQDHSVSFIAFCDLHDIEVFLLFKLGKDLALHLRADPFREEHAQDIISAYPREIRFDIFREIADEVGALFMVDMAHIAGLVAAGLHQNPVDYADIVTSTTHKTLRGPRGGLILCKEKFAKAIDKAIFPGTQGGPLMHVIAAKAVCFKEAMDPEFTEYQKQVVANAKALAEALNEKGFDLVSGGTDNHLVLVKLLNKNITGKLAEKLLDDANITTNKNAIPNDPESPFVTSGLRLGTPAMTSRGFKEDDVKKTVEAIALVIDNPEDEAAMEKARAIVKELTDKYPLHKNFGKDL